MSTPIEWTDETWNLINGCTVVSPGCTNCYAMRLAATRFKNSDSRKGLARIHNGHPQWTGEVLFNRRVALQPFQWKDPRKVFVCAHGDLFHEKVPDAWIDYVFMVALLNPRHTFQILTKRPERMREYMLIVLDETEQQTAGRFAIAMKHAGIEHKVKAEDIDLHWPPRNVWLGTSVEDQQRADERIPVLLNTPAAIHWLSCEPLLGPVDLKRLHAIWPVHWSWDSKFKTPQEALAAGAYAKQKRQALVWAGNTYIRWVVAGGESGPDSRPMNSDWARSLRDQCAAAEVPFLFKQWGDWAPAEPINDPNAIRVGDGMQRIGKKAAGRLLDGVHHDGYPAVAHG